MSRRTFFYTFNPIFIRIYYFKNVLALLCLRLKIMKIIATNFSTSNFILHSTASQERGS